MIPEPVPYFSYACLYAHFHFRSRPLTLFLGPRVAAPHEYLLGAAAAQEWSRNGVGMAQEWRSCA